MSRTQAVSTDVVESFINAFATGYLAGDIGEKLCCSEVEALAALLRDLGYAPAADQWIKAHAGGDDCGDMHCRCEDCTAKREAQHR